LLSSASAHCDMGYPPPRAHPLIKLAAGIYYECIMGQINECVDCAPKPLLCGGYKPDKKFGTVIKAGEVIKVNFYNQNVPRGKKDDRSKNQGRHNGGLCQFSLSYDGGKNFVVISEYHRTCPDVFYDWKVKIPDNIPSCDKLGKCIFSWSWINNTGNREFYQNCADVKIIGKKGAPALKGPKMLIANLKGYPTLTPPGEQPFRGNFAGKGPLKGDGGVCKANSKCFQKRMFE